MKKVFLKKGGWNIGELLGYSLDYRRSTLTINDTHAKTWKQGDTRKENPQRTSLGHHDYKKDNHKENVNGEKCKTPSEKGDVRPNSVIKRWRDNEQDRSITSGPIYI